MYLIYERKGFIASLENEQPVYNKSTWENYLVFFVHDKGRIFLALMLTLQRSIYNQNQQQRESWLRRENKCKQNPVCLSL